MRHFLRTTGIVFFILPALAIAKPTKIARKSSGPLSKEALMIELTGRDENTLSDVELYSEIVAAYQSQDEIGLKSRLQKFMSRYSTSSFADNALYLAGRQALENKNYGEAIRFFQRVQADYPRGNRSVAAQFSKAMAYKRMHLEPQARRAFHEVIQKYPGSPESFRADSEIRLLK